MITTKVEIIIVVFRYRVQVYNVFVERGNVAVLQCGVPASVRDSVEVKNINNILTLILTENNLVI